MSFKKLFPFLLLLLPTVVFSQTTAVSADSIYAHIKHLSETIGPRPMGSVQEQQAINWAEQKLRDYGADSTFIMHFTGTETHNNRVNTQSGVAVGIFRGVTDSAIVVGGHIDSDGREIPGANDNASGPATTLELARIWSQRQRHYTMIFCAFGGEERGLFGSYHFVDNYKDIDDVALMLSIDMTGADDDIFILMETDTMMAPKWLIRDAFDLDRKLSINRLRYPTHFCTINNIGDGAGSDHIPFLKHRIPAMDFTVGINNSPIHTMLDNMDFIHKDMLDKCGRLIDGLLVKYQTEGIPSEKSDPFILLKFLGLLLYIPTAVLPFISGIAVLTGIIAFIFSRKQRLQIKKPDRIRFSGFKLLFMLFVIFICYRLGDSTMQLLKGVRYPWLVHLNTYLWSGLVWLGLGVWVSLQLTKKWKFSLDSYVYAKRGLIILLMMTLLFAIINLRMAAYPALAFLLFSLAVLLPSKPVKLILITFAPLPMLQLMFMEAFPFMARFSSYAGFQINTGLSIILFNTAIFLLLMIWYLPFIYLFAWGVSAVPAFKKLLRVVRKVKFGFILLALLIISCAYLMTLPTHNEMWRPQVRVEADYDISTTKNSLEVLGNDFLKGVSVKTDSIDKQYNGKILKDRLDHSFTADWFNLSGNETITRAEADTMDVQCHWQITSDRPWYTVKVTIRPDTAGFHGVDSDLKFVNRKNTITFSWFSEPPEKLDLDVTFSAAPGAKLIRRITAVYPEMPIPIQVKSNIATVRYRTTVTQLDTLTMPGY